METGFKSSTIESLLAEINNYSCAQTSIATNGAKYSYMKGIQLVLDNLFCLYAATESSRSGSAKIYALNCTVNKKVLSNFFKGIKEDLGISEKIFGGGELNIPVAKNLSDKIIKNYEECRIEPDYFILGVKKIAK